MGVDKLKKIRKDKGCSSAEANLKQGSDFEVYKRADEGVLNSARVIDRAKAGKPSTVRALRVRSSKVLSRPTRRPSSSRRTSSRPWVPRPTRHPSRSSRMQRRPSRSRSQSSRASKRPRLAFRASRCLSRHDTSKQQNLLCCRSRERGGKRRKGQPGRRLYQRSESIRVANQTKSKFKTDFAF